MGEIAHPDTGDSIDVEIIDTASHNGDYVQVEAVDDDIDLSDRSDDQPWINAEEVDGR